jgi:hypothetical protein
MSGIFARLGFDYTDSNNIIALSNTVTSYLNTVPKFLEPWQEADIANNAVGGYFKNPVSNVANSIITVSGLIASNTFNVNGTSGATSTLLDQIYVLSANLASANGATDLFIKHTNKVSGVTPLGAVEEDAIYPYYVTAMSTGQSVMYLTNQSDGIQNNAPIMGSFTSLFIDANLSSLVVTAQTYPQIIKNSITITVGGIFPNTYNILTSNLSESTLQTIYSNVTTIDSVLSTRTNHDINYFRNANIVLDEMDSLLIFTGMGETAEKLVDEFIGTPKLLSRINA